MDLREYQSQPLARSPLVLVAAQVNFEDIGEGVAHKSARAVQDLVGPEWRQLQSAPLKRASMSASGDVIQEPQRQAYRLLTAGGGMSALLNPDAVTVETREYSRWEEFADQVKSFVSAVAEVFDPGSRFRLGLRYVDQIPLPEGRDSWLGLIPDSLLGMYADDPFASGVLATDERVLLQLDEATRCVMRKGLLADDSGKPGASFLLDFDVFKEQADRYDMEGIMAGLNALHAYSGQLFRSSVTDELFSWLKGDG